MLKRIAPDQIALGMYIRKFDGRWLDHPFWLARFTVKNEAQIARIRASGVDIFIDTEKGAGLPAPPAAPAGQSPRRQSLIADPQRALSPALAAPISSKKPARVAAPLAFGKADKARAAALAERSAAVVKTLFQNCELDGLVSTAPILSVVGDIATTLEQNSSAFINVTRLRSKDDAVYTHSVAVCALMIGLAREAGSAPALIRAMGTAGLLHDVGKIVLDPALLTKSEELADTDIAAIRRHPEAGHQILVAEAGLPPAALDVCLNHHERLDGSGYPWA